ncbi:four helix bundle protein, partial [bacterium]|nr:four helix bundle protein [bacterium]
MKDNIILGKSFDFAIRIVKLYKYLCDEKREYILSKQLLRCGTSIGANINEGQAGQSKADFIAKMSIASKEARESKYWIDLLIKTDYL